MIEVLIQPGPPDTRGVLTGFYLLSLVYMEENSKLSLANDFKELNWGVWDIIKRLDSNSQTNKFFIQIC